MSSVLPTVDACWDRIGVSGDRSCPELRTHVHCRNCPVHAAAASMFLDRPTPDGYTADWTLNVAAPETALSRDRISLAVFRLGEEWLALATSALVEVTGPQPIHHVPHRGDDVLRGLVNIRGRLSLFASLHGLLGIATPSATSEKARFIVLGAAGETWVFAAEEVAGVYGVPRGGLRAVVQARGDATGTYASAVFTWRDRIVAHLDENRIAAALRERCP